VVPKHVTDRRATDIARREAAELSQIVTEQAPDALYVTDADGAIVYVNESARLMLGYEPDELIGRDSHAALHHVRPDGTPVPIERRRLAKARGTGAAQVTVEDSFWRKDGSMLAVVCSSSPVELDGETGSVVVFRDVSAQRATFRRAEVLYRTLIANLPDTSVFLLDHDLRVLVAAGEASRRLPWFDEERFRGRKVTELHADIPGDLVDLSVEHYRAALRGERRTFEFDSDGMTFAVHTVPVRAEDGSVESALVVASDITERMRATRRLARHLEQHNALAELSRFALDTHNVNMLMTVAVACATTTLGVEVAGVLELDADGETLTLVASVGVPDQLLGGEGGSLAERPIAAEVLRTGEPVIVDDLATETRFTSSEQLLDMGLASSLGVVIAGHDKPFGVLYVHARRRRAFSDDDVRFLGAIATLITSAVDRHREEQATRQEALHDPLTHLPNRTLALDRIAQALARRRREGIDVVIFALDVDRFKMINDSFGHAAGDEVLLTVAPRLIAAVRPSDTVARLGGDEFVVICVGVDAASQATEVAERLSAAARQSLVLESGEHSVTVSIGITVSASPQDTPGSLLRDADVAMYRAKERGRGRYELFDEAMRTEVMIRMRTESELRRALDAGEFKVWYQPVIDLATGRPVSIEALVRWDHPRARLPPDRRLAAAVRHAPGGIGQRLRPAGDQPALPGAGGEHRRGERPAGAHAGAGDHRERAHGGGGLADGDPQDDAGPRAERRPRRLRHRILLVEPPEALPARRVEDRPLVHLRGRHQQRRPRHRQGDDRHGARRRPDRRRRRRRDPRAGELPARVRLRPCPGLPLLAPATCGGDHRNARRRIGVAQQPHGSP
jgi:diguanylate cyclase (GGDEF)-like protein/PAS domain S-box-containing protein